MVCSPNSEGTLKLNAAKTIPFSMAGMSRVRDNVACPLAATQCPQPPSKAALLDCYTNFPVAFSEIIGRNCQTRDTVDDLSRAPSGREGAVSWALPGGLHSNHHKERILLSAPILLSTAQLSLSMRSRILPHLEILNIQSPLNMFPQKQGLPKEGHDLSAGTKVDEGKRVQTLHASDLSSLRRQEYLEGLLPIDLTQHRGDSDKLLSIAIDLQTLGREQKAEIKKLQAKQTIVETKTVSSGYSRHGTNDSKSSTAASLGGDPEETVLVFSLLDNGLTVRQIKGMKEADYIKADLPPFQWWSDRLHVYFQKRSSSESSAYDRPQVIVQSKLGGNATRDATFTHTIRLGQLGFGIKFRRIIGQIRTLYVLYPQPHSVRSPEMTKYSGKDSTSHFMSAVPLPPQPDPELETSHTETNPRGDEVGISGS